MKCGSNFGPRSRRAHERIFVCCVVLLLSCSHGSVWAGEFLTERVAGTGASENNGDAGRAPDINIGQPFGVEVGPDGALYVTEVLHHRVRRLDRATGELTTVAGTGQRGYAGDGGTATQAEMNEPYEVRFDASGNMFVIEMKNHIVRRIDAKTGTISTVAGTGQAGFSGDGGPATKATFNQPHSIALDREGAVYIADIGNHRIRRVDPKTGIVDTIAGNGERIAPQDGQPARGNPLVGPRALFCDGDSLWIALRDGHSVWQMQLADGILHHVAGTGAAGFAGDGGAAVNAKFNGPKGIAVAPGGDIFVVDAANNRIRRIVAATGLIETFGGGNSAAGDSLNQPHGVCVSADGSVFVGDTLRHRVVRVRKIESEEKDQVLRHLVVFKFKPTSTKEDIDRIVQAFRDLPGKIDAITGFQWGENIGKSKFSDDLTHCFFLTFNDEAGRAAYLPHPDHKAFGAMLRPHLDKVFVVDYWGRPQPHRPEKELKHAVLFKFKDGTSKADIAAVEEGLAGLPAKIDVIKSFEWGTNNSPETHDQGFTHCFMFAFDSEEALKKYADDPAHVAVAKDLMPKVEKIRVLDFWTGGADR